jgi:DegV family protein with EDD domain
MDKIKLITDTAADLPKALREKYQIDIVPLSVRFDSEEITDTVNFEPELFWQKCAQSYVVPSTSAPSPGQFQQAFLKAKSEGFTHVLVVTLSAKMSATYSAALKAQELTKDQITVEVIDSRTVTGAQALIVISLAELLIKGASFDELIQKSDELISKSRLLGIVDTLEYLKKGGRIGGAAAFVGSLLSIKPVIEVRDGEVQAESKQRTLSKALDYVLNKAVSSKPVKELAVIHAQSPVAGDFINKTSSAFPELTPLEIIIGPIIGSHTGPGAIGLAYITQ